MKLKAGWSAAVIALMLFASSAMVAAQESKQHNLKLRSRVFENTRTIRVLLPPGYNDPANRARRYPVFYFTDGIAAWDAWGVTEVAREMWSRNEIPEIIFVGIDNGGSTLESKDPARDRASEYLPYPDQTWTDTPPEPKGDRFPAFLLEEVMPLINREFRTKPEGAHTGLAGDSYAAVAALYTAMNHPDRLGFLLIESPSLHIGNGHLLKDAAAVKKWPESIYIGVGTAEGDTPDAQAGMVAAARKLHATLDQIPQGPRVHLVVKEKARHWYDAWKERLPEALRFLLSGARNKD